MTRSSLDPRVAAAAAVAAWAVALGSPAPATAAWVAALAFLARLGRPRALRALWPPVAIALLGAAALAATRDGTDRIEAAVLLGVRIVAAGWVGAALVASLPLAELLGALAWARVPAPLLELIAIGDRQRQALLDHAAAVRDAQRLRLGWAGPRRALRSVGQLGGLAAWRAISQAEVTATALALRGASGHRRHPLEPRLDRRTALFAAGTAVALSAGVLLPALLRT